MLEKLQKFTNKKLAALKQEDETFLIYDNHGDLVVEVQFDEGNVSRIEFYDVEHGRGGYSPSAMIDAVIRSETTNVHSEKQNVFERAHAFIQTFDNRELLLDTMIDFDSNYLALYEETDERYGIALPNTGVHISISKDGMINSATFFHESYTVAYPESLISREEAAEVIKHTQLMELTIDTESTPWQYTYGPNHNVMGVDVDGKLITMKAYLDLAEISYDRLPKVIPTASITEYVQGDLRDADVHYDENDSRRIWYVEHEEHSEKTAPNYTKGELYERALCVLQLAVGDAYEDYRLEHTPNIDGFLEKAPFYMPAKDDEMSEVSLRFVYQIHGIYLTWHAAEVTLDMMTASITHFSVAHIPYEELKNLRPPLLTLDVANEKARSLVGVELTWGRADLENNIFKLDYSLCYPTSTTGGNIQKVDAYTGDVTFVDTGIV